MSVCTVSEMPPIVFRMDNHKSDFEFRLLPFCQSVGASKSKYEQTFKGSLGEAKVGQASNNQQSLADVPIK